MSTTTPATVAATEVRTTLASLLHPVKGTIALVFTAGFIAAGFALVPPIAITILATHALAGALTPMLAWTSLVAAVGGMVASHLLHKGATGHAHIVESQFRHDLRSRIARHVARLPLGWHTAESSGRVRTVIVEDVTRIHTIIAHFGADLGLGLGAPLLGMIYLFTLSWSYALFPVGWFLLFLLIAMALMSVSQKGMSVAFMEAEKDLTATTVELTEGIATVKAFGLSGTLFRRFSDALDRYTKASFEWMKGPGTPIALLKAVLSPAGMLVPIVGGGLWLAGAGVIEPVLIIPFLLVGVTLPVGLQELVSLSYLVMQGNDAAERIGAIVDETPLPEAATPEPLTFRAGSPAISFDAVSFRYSPEGPVVIDEVDLSLPAGSITAVVGPSGSGKSTLVRLIARFWDVDSGAVRVGGTDVRSASTPDLLSAVAIVLQEGGIITDTVTENIRMARPHATMAEVVEASIKARIYERIMALPNGFDTVLGVEGAHLSGGEAQRIALARAFLADAPILLLDEATAQADPHSERLIQEALGALAKGRTVVVIAHRLATVQDADRIIVLDQGRIAEEGTHSELLAAGGTYAQMWEAQQ